MELLLPASSDTMHKLLREMNVAADMDSGNGCIASPTTTQLECLPDTTSNGFSLACDGTLLLNNNTHFFECSTPGDEDQRKLYVTQPSNNTDCFDIVFGSQDCLPACPSSSSAASPTPTSTTSATPTPSSTSPYSLTQFRPPSLILPLSSTSPSRAPGTSYDGIVNSTTSSVFVFDFDSSYSGSTCALTFLLPPQADLTSSSYTLTGPGGIDIALLAGNADEGTTFNNKPGVETDYGVVTLSEGTASRFASSPCPVGTEISYELSTKDGTSLVFFEDSANPA